jgi:hypothetical protein
VTRSVALLAIPLVHHILGLHLKNDNSDVARAKRSNRLNSLIKAIRIFHSQYDGVEWLSSVLKKALQPDESAHIDEDRAREWRWELEKKPISYLKITFTVDFSLSKSRFAEESDTPAYLDELVSGIPTHGDTHALCTEFACTDQQGATLLSIPVSLDADTEGLMPTGQGADIDKRTTQPSLADDKPLESVYSETQARDVAHTPRINYDGKEAFIEEGDFVILEIQSTDVEMV